MESHENLSLFETAALLPESEIVEYKQSWQEDCLKDLAAFANTRGGTLYVGIQDDRTVCGWGGAGQEEEVIGNKIVNVLGIHPRRMAVERHKEQDVLAIVMAQTPAPVGVRGRYYRRVGNSTREVPEEERVRFLLERTGSSWDELPSDAGWEGISEDTMADFRVLARERLPRISAADTSAVIFEKLSLCGREGSIKRGALLLFGRSPQRTFRSTEVQVGRFQDDATIVDEKSIGGNLFEQLAQTMQAIRNYVLVRYAVPEEAAGQSPLEDLQRQELWECPYAAVREAILNAAVHRDYTRPGSVQVRVYEDRLTVRSPGGLLAGLTVQDLFREPHDSLRRNPILAGIMYYVKFVERWGTGTIRMRNACRQQNAPDPEFESTEAAFTVTLRKGGLTAAERFPLNADEFLLLEWARTRQNFSVSEAMGKLGLPRRRITYRIQQLIQRGFLLPEGEGRWRRYRAL